MSSFVEPQMKSALKDHTLDQVLDTEKFKAFYLRPPGGGRMMSTLLIFSPEGITLCGDLWPGGPGNGACQSPFGYRLDWFASQLQEDYLCEKFLQKSWQDYLAAEWCRDEARGIENEEERKSFPSERTLKVAEKLNELAEYLEGGGVTIEEFCDDLEKIMTFDRCDTPGYGYDKGQAGCLCAIQQRFAELYNAAKTVPPATVQS